MNPRGVLSGWRVWVVVAVGLVVCNLVVLGVSGANPRRVAVPYSEFERQLGADNVATVTFRGHAVTGTFKTAVPNPSAGRANAPARVTYFTTDVP